jgi:hypothetical protein
MENAIRMEGTLSIIDRALLGNLQEQPHHTRSGRTGQLGADAEVQRRERDSSVQPRLRELGHMVETGSSPGSGAGGLSWRQISVSGDKTGRNGAGAAKGSGHFRCT